MAQVR